MNVFDFMPARDASSGARRFGLGLPRFDLREYPFRALIILTWQLLDEKFSLLQWKLQRKMLKRMCLFQNVLLKNQVEEQIIKPIESN